MFAALGRFRPIWVRIAMSTRVGLFCNKSALGIGNVSNSYFHTRKVASPGPLEQKWLSSILLSPTRAVPVCPVWLRKLLRTRRRNARCVCGLSLLRPPGVGLAWTAVDRSGRRSGSSRVLKEKRQAVDTQFGRTCTLHIQSRLWWAVCGEFSNN